VLPGQFDVLRAYIEQHHRRANGEHLWIRVHPQSVRGPYATARAAYETLRRPSVTVELPPVRSEELSWDLEPSDQAHVADLLAAAHVVVTPQSTFALDAACVDTPIVALAIGTSARRLFQYRHYRPVIETGAVSIANSLDELRAAVEHALEFPGDRRSERAELRRLEMGPHFGYAAVECAAALTELATSARGQNAGAPLGARS
jgi:hypothetical protein